MAPALLSAFAPDRDGLLRRLATLIDDGMLREIAACDYGFGLEDNLKRLHLLRDELEMPDFNAREVLELTRWAEPDWENWSGPKGERGHRMRAFACAGLLHAPEDAGQWGALNDTLGQMIASLDALPGDWDAEAAAFLAWRMAQFAMWDHAAFVGVGLLHHALRLPDVADAAIVALCEWISSEEREVAGRSADPSGRWLLSHVAGQRHANWENIGMELSRLDLSRRPAAVREWVSLIGGSLAP